jgi:ribosomal-protein-alanine N-acetyltransferase
VLYAIRSANEVDVPQLAEIEKEAFPTTWPATQFKRELSNRTASFLVAYQLPEKWRPVSSGSNEWHGEGSDITTRGLRGFWHRFFQKKNPPASFTDNAADYVAGYVTTWYMTDEAHIAGIAVRKSLKGNGLGELLLMASIELAMRHQSRVVTLEVRVSNHVAQSLYSKYGFRQVGRRKGYYSDNHEDAYIMTTDPIFSPAYREQLTNLEEIYKSRRGDIALGLG